MREIKRHFRFRGFATNIEINNSNTHTSFGAWSPVHARARRGIAKNLSLSKSGTNRLSRNRRRSWRRCLDAALAREAAIRAPAMAAPAVTKAAAALAAQRARWRAVTLRGLGVRVGSSHLCVSRALRGGRGKEEPLSAIATVLHAAPGDDGLPVGLRFGFPRAAEQRLSSLPLPVLSISARTPTSSQLCISSC